MTEASDLFAELANDQDPRHSRECRWQTALKALNPTEAEQFAAAILNPAFTVASISRALEKRKVNIARNTLERHRRGECVKCQT